MAHGPDAFLLGNRFFALLWWVLCTAGFCFRQGVPDAVAAGDEGLG